jgi:hypothetical protein
LLKNNTFQAFVTGYYGDSKKQKQKLRLSPLFFLSFPAGFTSNTSLTQNSTESRNTKEACAAEIEWIDPRLAGTTTVRVRLGKALYGLKQAPRLWYQEINEFLLSIRFTQSTTDPNLYIQPECKERVERETPFTEASAKTSPHPKKYRKPLVRDQSDDGGNQNTSSGAIRGSVMLTIQRSQRSRRNLKSKAVNASIAERQATLLRNARRRSVSRTVRDMLLGAASATAGLWMMFTTVALLHY